MRSSPWFIGPYYAHMADRPIYRSLLETLRTDEPGGWAGAKSRKHWAEEMKDDAFAEQFTGTMDARGLYVGTVLAERLNLQGRRRVLDVAGGSGIYACCIAAAHPHVRATVFERSPVDRLAAKCIANGDFQT